MMRRGAPMFWRICRYVSAGTAAAIIAAIALLYTAENDRANFTISGIGFDPFPLVANKRTYIVLRVKNTGHNYGTITAASLDRVNVPPTEPTYDPAKIASDTIAGGDEKRIISDLGKSTAFPMDTLTLRWLDFSRTETDIGCWEIALSDFAMFGIPWIPA
jgi:hypothetical protein